VDHALLADLSRELRTPLVGILGSTALLASTKATEEEQESLDALENSAAALLSVLESLEDYSAIAQGKLALENRSFDFLDAVEDVLNREACEARRLGVSFHSYLDPNLNSHMRGDSRRIRQVLGILIRYAARLASSGGLQVSFQQVDAKAHQCLVQVQIAFRRKVPAADAKPPKDSSESLLTFAVARKLVHLMGGYLDCDLAHPETGCLWLCLRLDAVPAIPTSVKALPGSILVYADEKQTAEELRNRADLLGLNVLTAVGRAELLATLDSCLESPVAFLLFDVESQGANTAELVRRMSGKDGRRLRAVGATWLPESSWRDEMARLHADAFVAKPVSRQALHRSLQVAHAVEGRGDWSVIRGGRAC
jgi:CheY-like chemotaxis protein